MSSSIDEINRLVSKGMYVSLFKIRNNSHAKHSLLRKFDVLKTSILSEFEEMHNIWKGTRYIRENVYIGIIVYIGIMSFFCKTVSQIFFSLFWSGDKRIFLSEFLRKWGWFHGHNERFPRYHG